MEKVSAIALAAGLVLAALSGCNSVARPPTPILTGPDSGATHVATVFAATSADPHNEGTTAVTCFDWGDGSNTGGYTMGLPYEHVYSDPGSYVVKCRFLYAREHLDWFAVEERYGDWSNPCTVNIAPNP